MKKIFTLCLVLCMSYLSMGATNLKHEFRATWLTTAWGNDWPKTKVTNDATRKQQQDSLIAIFDRLQAGNMNAVCLQVRGRSDAFYQSSYEPWAAELAGARGTDPGYDPLAFAIKEAHKRGLELHAWVNPFRVTSAGTLASTDLVKKNAGQWIIQYNNGSFTGEIIDPGYPEAREYVLNVLMEIISNYDIDGIVMDDYFYPYGGTTTEDAASKALHKPANVVDVNQDGYTDDDWRRSNVDVFLKEFYNRIQTTKPWVRLGMGTFGIWTTQSKVAQAYGISLPSGISGLDDYDEQACNPVEWVKNGYVDYINPQLYWPTTSTRQNYNKLCQWWAKDVCEHFSNQLTNGKKVHFFSSQSISSNSAVSEIQAEIDANRSNLSSGYTGSVFFDTDAYLTMDKDLMTSRFATNALTPPMDWKSKTALSAPTNLTISGTTLTWQHATAERFTVYVYPKGTAWSTAKNDPAYLQGVIYGNTMDISGIDTTTHHIAVCAYDRFGVEHEVAIYSNDSGAGTTPNPETIIWELNGGEVNTVTVEIPTQSDLMLQFMNDYVAYFGTPTIDVDAFYPTGNMTGFLYRGKNTREKSVNEMILDETAGWKWLADYIISTSASNTSIVAALNSGTEVNWRYSIAAFFEQNGSGTYNVDFSTAGQPAAWGPTYQMAHGMVLLPTYVTSAYTLPTPTHPEGLTFLGWYDNPAFSGSSLTIIPAHWTGTLYAKWQEDTPTIDPTWQITYTSTDGNIVTPHDTTGFGANIVSNTYENGVGTITFDGPVTSIGDFAFCVCDSLTSITIPNSVTSIGYQAFQWCESLTSITIPNSVTSIGSSAFRDCSSLPSITIPNSVTSIGDWAFSDCSSLTSVTIPNSVTSIGVSAFCSCSSLTSVTIPNSVTSIGEHAFYNCTSLTFITIPNSVTNIENATFALCSSLTSVTIPNSVTSIGNYAFNGCSSLTSITIPNSVMSIGWSAFGDCDAITSVVVESGNATYDSRENCNAIIETATNTLISGCQNTIIPSSVISIGGYAFEGCSSLTSITIPSSVTSIGGYAFEGCSSLTSITIPSSVTSIGESAFYYCSSLTSVTLGSGVTSIGERAFFCCFSLTSITIPESVTSISFEVFSACDALTSIVVDSGNTTYDSRENCNAIIKTATNTLVAGCQSTIIPNSVTSIGEGAFFNCHSLSSLTISNSVTSIGERAFYYCRFLTSITLPNSVTSIGGNAFSDCYSLDTIHVEATTPPALEDSTVFIGTPSPVCIIPCGTLAAYEASDWAQYVSEFVEDCVEGQQIYYTSTNDSIVTPYNANAFGANIVSNIYENGVGTITFDGPITSIGYYAFRTCMDLTSIIIPESVNSIGAAAFVDCRSLASITIPNSVTSIGGSAFLNCYSLSSITIPNGVNSIEGNAFASCTSLTSITIPNSATTIGEYAFDGCTSLTSVTIPQAMTIIGKCAFRSCKSITSIIIPNSVTEIGAVAFGGCGSLKSMIVERGNTTYDSRENCNAIIETATNTLISGCQNTIIPNSVKNIGPSAFSACFSLASITIPNGVMSIGKYAFSYCVSLDTIYVESITPPALEDSTVFKNHHSPVCVIPCGILAAYEASDWANYMGEFVEDCVEGQQIYYTSTNDSIVTPYNVNAFDANIVSNIYENGVGTITFDAPITSIGENAFQYCSSLTSITISNSVTSIGNFAFRGCLCLSSITIPNSVTNIESHAFRECSSLKSITIPSSVTGIGKGAFEGALENYCGLVSITVDSDNRIYDSRENCNAIIETATNTLVVGCQNTIIPNSVTIIGERAFRGSTFTSITIPSSVTSIEYLAFFECDSLDAIYMEAITPPTLGNQVFNGAASFSMHIPCGTLAAYEASDWAQYVSEFIEEGCPTVQMCGDDLYWEYADGVLTITGTGDMYDYAADTDVPWYDVRGNIKTVSLPDAMTKIGQNAFYKCTAMTTINMPTSLTAIGEKAFAQDTKLACEIILPASMTNIATRAFFNCQTVTAFHIEATTPPTIPNDAFERTTAPIHVPCGYGHIYGKHTQWGELNLEMCELLQDNVYYYPIDGHTARAVTYHSNPTDTIVIPSAVVIDGMPRTVTEVADFAFADCKDIPAIIFNEGLEYLGERAFVRCYGLHGTIVLPATLETISERAFSYCNNVEKYLIQAMTPPALGANAFTGDNKNALFYISCEAMDDYKVATNWSSLKSRLRDACLNIYHYNTPLGTNGVYTTEDTLVASIYYRRQFTPYRWETLYLPFEVDRVTVLEDGEEFDLRPWNIITGGDYYLAKPDGMLNLEILFDFTDELEAHTPYIIQFVYDYYRDKIITFYGKESWNKLSTSFEVLSSSAWMQIAGNTTLQDQLLEKPVYMLRSGLDFILQKTTTTLHPFECYVMPYTAQSGAPARMNVRMRDDVATAVESVKGNESYLTYSVDGYTLTVYPQGQAFSIYSLNGALIYSCEAGKEAVDCELNSGCYLLHAGAEAHKIML